MMPIFFVVEAGEPFIVKVGPFSVVSDQAHVHQAQENRTTYGTPIVIGSLYGMAERLNFPTYQFASPTSVLAYVEMDPPLI